MDWREKEKYRWRGGFSLTGSTDLQATDNRELPEEHALRTFEGQYVCRKWINKGIGDASS
jgi:hypothetical protein